MSDDKVVVGKVGSYFLVLPSDEHVQVLCDILASISGHADRTRRRYSDDILRAIANIGFEHRWEGDGVNGDTTDIMGSVQFLEEPITWNEAVEQESK